MSPNETPTHPFNQLVHVDTAATIARNFELPLHAPRPPRAGVYEIGRIDTGDALRPRAEDEEREKVFGEFQSFAEANLERCSETTSVNQVMRFFQIELPAPALGYNWRRTPLLFTSPHECPPLLLVRAPEQVEVIRLFRRSLSRHRRADQPGSASDALLADCLRAWHQQAYGVAPNGAFGPGGVQEGGLVSRAPPPTSSGFFKGIRIKSTYTGF